MAIRFNASGESLSRSRLAGAKTVMAWIYISTDRNDYTGFFGLGSTEVVATTGTGTTILFYDGSIERTGTNLTAATWYHLAYSSQGDTINDDWAVYLNGATDISHTGRSLASAGTNMYLGNDEFDEWLNGRLAHVKIWNAQLTQAEIQQEMYTIRPQRYANLWCWMPMIETASSRDNEWSGSGNTWTENGTLSDEDGPPISWGVAPWVVPFVATGGGGTTYYSTPAGSMAPSGAQTRRTSKTPAGSVTPAGVTSRLTSKTPAGSVTPTGATSRRTSKYPAGALGLAGALAAVRTVLASVGGALAPAGSLARSTAKGLAGSVGLAGALVRSTAKSLAGALGLAGALATQLVGGVIEQAVGGTLALAGTLARATSITVSGTLAPAGSIARQIGKSLAGALGLAGSMVASWFSPSAPKLDVTLSDAAQTTLTIANAAQTTLSLANAAQTTLTIGDAAV